MPGEQHHVVIDLSQTAQTLHHERRIAAGEIRAAAAIEKQGVAADEPPIDHEALTSGRMARRMDELNVDVTDCHDVTGSVGYELRLVDTRGARDPWHFVNVNMNRAVDDLQEIGDARKREAKDRSTDVIGVVVRREGSHDRHAV